VHEISERDRADRMQRSQALTVIRSLARSLDGKDDATGEHSTRVAALARDLALHAGWEPARAALLHDSALIHDVGKVVVPDAVLLATRPLSRVEHDLMKMHAPVGAQIASKALNEEQVCWIKEHHERYDGSGYPDGLMGSEISDGASLLAVAESWDAMTTARRYRPAMPPIDALAECAALSGVQFHPTAYAALASMNSFAS
jgi:putative nucleotidyltransferase with HDIG domain